MSIVTNFFNLDNGKTKSMLNELCGGVYLPEPVTLDYKFSPDNMKNWRSNPFSAIANSDELWAAYIRVAGNQGVRVTLTSFFQSLAICQFWVMDNQHGPEGDSAKQMLRKHWYAWGKLALQPAASRLGVGLMENGTPDSEKLYDLMSRTLGDWNEQGSLEYRQVWVENNSTMFHINDRVLPSPFDTILICCEKDAAFNGVVTSAIGMGALAVYSGGGKSSRSGIEKLYYAALQNKVREGRTVYVLVISDWDTDGESVIAPTFVEQLKTYIPESQLQWTRVGIKPEQVAEFGYDLIDKEYAVKWNVAGQLNYLEWCRDHALFHYTCDCGHSDVKVSDTCPNCGSVILPRDSERPEAKDKTAMEYYKKQFAEFYEANTPGGLELDALTRIDYCKLLVEGLSQLVDIQDICNSLSKEAAPDNWQPIQNTKRLITDDNDSVQEAVAYKQKLQDWFDRQVRDLDDRIAEIESIIESDVTDWVNNLQGDDRIYEKDPNCDEVNLTKHMQSVRQNSGRCNACYRPTDRCNNPSVHRAQGSWEEPEDLFSGIERFRPFNVYTRQEEWTKIVKEDYADEIEAAQRRQFDYPTVDGIDLDE